MAIRVQPTALDPVVTIETDRFDDARGFFMETYSRRDFLAAGLDLDFVQDNHSRSRRHVLRGLHYQDLSAPMAKLVRCTRGGVLDVAADLRVGSPTFGRWVAVELNEENHLQLLVPSGFAHGFISLTDETEVQYRCTGYYAPAAEGAIVWNDPTLAIEWPVADPLVSDKDRRAETLEQYLEHPRFHYGR